LNYGEELGYWYLRLNGFFPIQNFVVHRSEGREHRSDVDVLAIRMPYVFEDVGGQEGDWDHYLVKRLKFDRPVGLICEVKTGEFDENRLFPKSNLSAAVGRLGLVPKDAIDRVVEDLFTATYCDAQSGIIAKLLIAPNGSDGDRFFRRPVVEIENFILERARRYAGEKYSSRMFFPSPMFQLLIAQVRGHKRGHHR